MKLEQFKKPRTWIEAVLALGLFWTLKVYKPEVLDYIQWGFILWGAFVLVWFLSEDPAEKDPDPDEASTGNEG